MHHNHLCFLYILILYSLNCGAVILTRVKSGFLEYFLPKLLTISTHLRYFRLLNTHQRQTLLALLIPSSTLSVLKQMPKDSLLRFKRISSSYEFFKLSFRLWLLIPSSIAALFLTNHIHVYSYFTSNVGTPDANPIPGLNSFTPGG